ncbi:MAG: LuxR family transcriptional regulator, quorum-sensing system regulator BjaR1 [Bradyrhizobium sp.]|jgi:LuxR family quorum sensing-dependent transcriptional regulator|nr:LuxR family transcriptional regulator, quorum-sensing system regulator BjaR1 [Bradyrhizobium sp.]
MDEQIFDPGREAFRFLEDIEAMTEQSAVIDRMSIELAKYGIDAWVITGLPSPGGRIEEMMLLNGWSQEWSSHYFKNNLVKDDPCVAHCFRSTGPFEWNDAPYDPLTWPAAEKMMNDAADIGMRVGFAVPIHTFAGFQAVVSMGGEHVNLSPLAKRAIHLMSLYAHDKASSVVRPRHQSSASLLTRREKEALRWVAAGKTAWEISQILSISQATVHDHLKAAARKFESSNRVATVVAALRRGEITL